MTQITSMQKKYRQTQYICSAHNLKQLPDDSRFEIAFAGRSNAGKSTAINALCDNKNLARTSRTPGRTQMINFFKVAEHKYFVDLPGYGYAKVPESMKRHWKHVLQRYFEQRQVLCGLILIVDIRRELSQNDWQMIDWAQAQGLNTHLLLTKCDKLKRGAASSSLLSVKKTLQSEKYSATAQLFSGQSGEGLNQAYQVLDTWLAFT